jgi:DNA-binding LacI/PurR family transcriptional regulator
MERAQGYIDEMTQAGLEPVVITHPTVKEIHEYVQHGEAYADQVLNHSSRPTAAMTFNGYEAFGLLSGLRNMGIRVPEQISVLGFNTQEMDTMLFFNPALTAVVEPSIQMGQEAAQMVFDILEGRPVTDQILDQKLVVRSSTGPPQER